MMRRAVPSHPNTLPSVRLAPSPLCVPLSTHPSPHCTSGLTAHHSVGRWVFRAARNGTTDISVESTVDSRGSIPVLLVNYIQRRWPAKALAAFYRLVKGAKVPPRPNMIKWGL